MKWPEGIPVGEVTRLAQPPSRPALRLLSDSLPPSPGKELCKELRKELGKGLRTGRELVRARREEGAGQLLPTAVDAVDRLLQGGIPRGQLVEIFGRRSSGRFSAVLGALAAFTGTGEAAALVDLGDSLDPASAERAGIDLARLLWLRPGRLKDALHGAEMLLTAGFPLVVLDLGNPPLKGTFRLAAAWLRLARAAEKQQAALLVASPYRISGAAASIVLQALQGRARWSGKGATPPLLQGIEGCWELKKCRRARPGTRPGDRQRLHLHTEPPPRPEANPEKNRPSPGRPSKAPAKGLHAVAG